MMRVVNSKVITDTVRELCVKANIELRKDVLDALKRARNKETGMSRRILDIIIKNALLAKKKKLPICQDTGMVAVYIKLGQSVSVRGDIKEAIEKGVRDAYRMGYFRKSVVSDPLVRKNTGTNLPALIYYQIVPGNKIDISVAVKGFGCENTSRTKMFRPTDPVTLIEKFIVDSIKENGANACPPLYVGIGIGGTLDKATSLSKEAIFRKVGERSKKAHIAKMEKRVLEKVNKSKIGPMDMGGKTMALSVSILTYPTHIAGLPVAVNISCHATRGAAKVI